LHQLFAAFALKPATKIKSRAFRMKTFPDFMKSPVNKVNASQQNTADIEGYYFQGADDTQIAFWECHTERISKKAFTSF
jgi:hypothetical protein